MSPLQAGPRQYRRPIAAKAEKEFAAAILNRAEPIVKLWAARLARKMLSDGGCSVPIPTSRGLILADKQQIDQLAALLVQEFEGNL